MRKHNIHRIYLATLVLGIAYGISIALTALVLDEHGFGKTQIGALAAVFASGIVLASLPVGAIVRRFSARATLGVATVGYALAVIAFPWPHSMVGVGAVRFIDGACSVGIWVSAETVLLAQSEKEKKAQVTSVYAIAMSIGYVVGPAIAYLVTAFLHLPMWVAFAVSGGIALFALIPILSLTKDAQLAPPNGHVSAAEDEESGGQTHDRTAPPSPWMHILWKIKTACFAT
ncbi:MAG: MFS transporter, partial [Polyangiaceae bacterium]